MVKASMESISAQVAGRLRARGVPFRANDNIAPYLEPGELDGIQAEVEDRMTGVLGSLVIDVENDHNTRDTARRIAKMFVREVFAGRYEAMPQATEFPNEKRLGDILVVGPMTVRSTCSHHFAPILGHAWVGVISGEKVLGVSKFSRLFSWFASRPQIQEELAVQVADCLEALLKPRGLAVVIKAMHSCMTWRGVKDSDSKMTTSVMRGLFMTSAEARQEFLELLK